MEKNVSFDEYYHLQDEVLSNVFSLSNEFYLTGGTALHRFYYQYRYSDDLDFFASNSALFNENVKELFDLLQTNFQMIEKKVESRDFYRFLVNEKLQIDFVNDRVFRYGKSNVFRGIKVDNLLNILTNKVSAILNRDEEKDVYDLFSIAYNMEFNWENVIEITKKKAVFETDILIYRLKNFPLSWLDNIKKCSHSINIYEKDIEQLIEDALRKKENSLINK